MMRLNRSLMAGGMLKNSATIVRMDAPKIGVISSLLFSASARKLLSLKVFTNAASRAAARSAETPAGRKTDNDAHDFAAVEIRRCALIEFSGWVLCWQCGRRRTEDSQKKQRKKNLAATIHEPFAGTFVQNEPFQLAFTKFVAVIWSFAPSS